MFNLSRRIRVLRRARREPAWVEAFRRVVTVAVLVSLVTIVIESGYRLGLPPALRWLVSILDYLILGLFAADIVVGYVFARSRWQHFRRRWLDLAVFVPVIVSLLMHRSGTPFIIVRQLVIVGQAFTRTRRFAGLVSRLRLQPVTMLALSFVGLIAAGTLLLTFPSATTCGRGAPFIDALFTSTSAVCVTGLIVRDTPVFFSRFGQLVILGLIQLGGIGIMTFSAGLAAVFTRRVGLARRRMVADIVEQVGDVDIVRTLRYIIGFTLLAEVAGAALLFARFLPDFTHPLEALYCAGFHSVSAFCNAGFSVFSNSLEGYAGDPAVNLVIIGLVVAGGLGFVVVHELLNRNTLRRGPAFALRRLTVHSRLVLWTSGLLVVLGALLFFFFEYDGALAHLRLGPKLLAALFQAVTPRTAGFNTVPFSGLKPVTLFLWVALMFIGASPGSTGGGIKTTTFAVLLLAVRARIQGRDEVEVRRRTVPRDVVYRATAIFVIAAGIVVLFFALLLAIESHPFPDLLFETVSAFGTVGLSTGVTGALTAGGKLLVILLMYVGRLGPLTLALAMRSRTTRLAMEYPAAEVMVG